MNPKTELEIIEAFYERVCLRAELNMLKTGTVEGTHLAALKTEIANLRRATAIEET